MGFGIGNELRERFNWKRRIDYQKERNIYDDCDWREIVDKIEIEVCVKAGVYCVRTGRH